MSTIRVDRITPYQSGSVAIEGLNITNLTIDGTLTASLQEGYVWVGGSGNVSTLTPTSSFAGGGGSDITALNAFTASADSRLDNLELTTSSLQNGVNALNSFTTSADGRLDNLELTTASADGRLDNLELTTASLQNEVDSLQTLTGSYATTGSNTFVGNQVITGSLTISGSSTFRNIGPTILSGSLNISGSINSDGYQLEASSTETIPVLNDSFNSDLSGSESVIVNKSLLLGDGKVLVAGKFQSIDGHSTNGIARFNSNGSIDTSFTSPTFGATFIVPQVYTFVTQSDDKIIVGGDFSTVDGVNRRGIARLNTNGTLDTTFTSQSFASFGEVRDIVIQSDDKILFVGDFTSGSRRVNTDGTLDATFDISQGNSQALSFNNGNFYSVALLDSGSEQAVLIGGDFQQWGSYSYPFLVKLNPNGTLDFGFAGSNLDIITGNSSDRINQIKVGDDGYIYVAGRFKDTGIGNNAGFARITTTDEGNGVGAINTSLRTYISGSYVNDFDFYDGDKILLGGNFTLFGNPGFSVTSANRFAIINQSNGGLVTNWSTDGLASKYNLNTGSVNSVTLLPSDNVLVGGTFTSASFPSTAREGLASLKLTGFGDVTTTIDYSITATTNELLISSSNTHFSGDITASVISGSFVGDGSGLIDITLPSGVVSGSEQIFGGSGILSSSETNFTDFSQSVDTRIDSIVSGTGFATTSSFNALTESFNSFTTSQEVLNVTFATTGSNTFFGNEVITGSFSVSGSISQVGVGGPGNIFIGDEPSTNMTSEAQYNVIIGQDAGILNSSGSLNVFIGKSAGLLNQIGNSNVMIGGYAGYNTKNSQNLCIGESAGFNNIMGTSNVFIGHQSGYSNKVSNNTFIGYQAGFDNTSGSENTFVGRGSGENNTTADNNSFFGYNSGRDNSVGENNTFLGNFAGQTNTSGSYNTFVGSSAGQNHKTAVYNTFVGMNAGLNTGVGNENTFLGFQAGNNNLSGSQCTLIGANANGLSTFSNYVTAVGYGAAYGVLTGSNSVYLGNAAGRYLSDGVTNVTSNTNSVFIGTDSKSNLNAQDNQIVIGYNAVSNGTNTVTIGNNDITDTYVKGTLRASTAILAQVSASYNFADDTAAAGGGVPLGGLYHTSGSIKIRLV